MSRICALALLIGSSSFGDARHVPASILFTWCSVRNPVAAMRESKLFVMRWLRISSVRWWFEKCAQSEGSVIADCFARIWLQLFLDILNECAFSPIVGWVLPVVNQSAAVSSASAKSTRSLIESLAIREHSYFSWRVRRVRGKVQIARPAEWTLGSVMFESSRMDGFLASQKCTFACSGFEGGIERERENGVPAWEDPN